MKRTSIAIIAAALGTIGAWAAASAPVAIAVPEGAYHPVLSPDGGTLLFTTDNHQGLNALNMTNGSITVIDTEAAAGFQPVFSADGSMVYYRTASLVDGMLYRDVRSYNMVDGVQQRVQAPSRDNVDLMAFDSAKHLTAVADYSDIKVHAADGSVTAVTPLADAHSYLWASVSPDGTRMLFCEPFQGVFVSNIDGSDARCILPKGDYPTWAGNNTVIAVVSHDDGYVILDSQLVAVGVNTGIVTAVSDADVKVSEATASDTGMVVYTTLDGKMYMLNLENVR